MLFLALVDEAIRFMTFTFLGSCASFGNPLASPILFQLANPSSSPLLAALQYLASVLFSTGPKTRLQIVLKSGYASIPDWEQEAPQDVRTFRRMVLLTISWLQRRVGDRIDEFPFSLVALADPNTSQEFRQSICQQWDEAHSCCVRPGFAAKLKKRHIRGDDLLSPKWLSL